MVVFNYSGGEINTKIVYYGPGLSGKTTNLEYIYSKMPVKIKGKMISMKTRTDRTLFFDFLPLDLGDISGFKLRFLLYTVPGQVYYNATRKLVLKGADAVIFVADSGRDKLEENIESLKNLETNLNEHDLSLDTIPWVIQYNKRDLDDAMPVAELEKALNVLNVPSFEAVATSGAGVYETFQKISSMLYYQVKQKLDREEREEQEQQAVETAEAGAADVVPAAAKSADLTEVVDSALREIDESLGTVTINACGAQPSPPPGEDVIEPRDAAGDDQDDVMESDEDRVTYDPPGIASRSMERSTQETDEFKFASLKDLKINGEVGRVIDLEEPHPSGPADTDGNDFITSPRIPSPQPQPQPAAHAAPAHAKPAAVDTKPEPEQPREEEVVVTVPVRISSSQVRRKAPVKLVLEIEFSGD